ncbi:MAG: hypothetical protein QMD50_00050 [Patescibacteria group bacterium]|nr:hypothetical protein [Patescibacteria group bacterium]
MLNPKFNLGDITKIFIHGKTGLFEVKAVGFDNCDGQHPIWEVISDNDRGLRVICSDVVYI